MLAADAQHAALALTAVANLAAARGTAAAYDPHLSPIAVHQPKPSALDKLSARLQSKLHGRGGAGGSPDGPEAPRPPAPGPRGAILSHDRAVPTLLQLVVSPEGAYPGSGAWGSGSFASLSPPDTPGSAASHSSAAAAFSFTPIGHLGRGGSAATAAALAADPQGVARLVLPPALLALNNLVTEAAGREQVRAWAKAHGRQAQLHSALNAAMGNRQLPQQVNLCQGVGGGSGAGTGHCPLLPHAWLQATCCTATGWPAFLTLTTLHSLPHCLYAGPGAGAPAASRAECSPRPAAKGPRVPRSAATAASCGLPHTVK